MSQNNKKDYQKIRFVDVRENLIPGESEVFSQIIGKATFVGFTSEGDAVVQYKDNITAIGELMWDMWSFKVPFQPETHVRYISEEDLARLHHEPNPINIELEEKADVIHMYRVTMTIEEVKVESKGEGFEP